jgi:hypothetical protein
MSEIYTPSNDKEYYRWLVMHPEGFVLNVGLQKLMLHHAHCANIKTHSSPGAMTERASRKICSVSRQALRAWVRQNNYLLGPKRCGTCSA